MAVASKTWTAAYGPYVRLRITAQEVEVDVPNNRSKVRVTGQIYYNGGTRATNAYSQTYTVTVNGTQIGRQTGITYNLAAGATRGLTTYTSGWIAHGSNGAKSVTVRGHITDGHGDTGTINQTYALTTIARASTLNSFSMPNALNWSTANKFNLGITRRSSSFTHDIQLRDGSTTIASWTGQGTPSTLTLSASQVNTLLNRTSGAATRTMTLRVQTKSGSTNIGGALTRTATASIHSSARASVLNSFSMPNSLKPDTTTTFNLGLTRRSSSFTHDISLRDGSTVIASWTGSGLPTTRTLTATQTNTLLRRMSSSTTRTMTLRVQTKSGSTNIGSALTRTATVRVSSTVTPNVSALSVTIEGNAHAKNNVKRFVQNISKVSGKFTRTATGGASISSSSLQIRRKSGGADLQTINTNSGTFPRVVALNGQYQARGTATDSRGRTSTTGWVDLSNFDVLAYSTPQITRFTTSRKTGAETTVGIYRGGIHSGLSGSNTLTIRVQKRASGTTSWTNVVPDVTTSYNAFGTDVESTGNSVASSYDFRLYIVDQFGNSAEQTSTVSTQRVVLDIHKNEGVGIGKIREQGVLDVDGAAYFKGDLFVNNVNQSKLQRFVTVVNNLGITPTDTISFWQTLPQGRYFVVQNDIPNQPSGYGIIDHTTQNFGANSDFNTIWYSQANGPVFRKSGNGASLTGWIKLAPETYGSNSNGSWIRFESGVQICWNNSFTVSYERGTRLQSTWTFPKEFIEAVPTIGTRESYHASDRIVSSAMGTALGTTTAMIRFFTTGDQLFPSGTTANARLMAIGRWK